MAQHRAYCVGLTGGIASGKSAACARFAHWGVPVLDADLISRELVAPGQPALAAIRQRFGATMITASGELDRRRLREHIFADDGERLALEAILHPRVRERLRELAFAADAAYVIVAIPLLVEVGRYDWLDRVIVIDVSEATQLARLQRRDAVDMNLARRMLAAQASREQRLRVADDVIGNEGSLEQLQAAIDALHQRLLVMANRESGGAE